jgi:predicted DNA-binding protein
MTKGTARVETHIRPEDRERLKQLAERHDRTVAAEIRRALGCYFEVAEGPVWTPLSKN